MIIYNYAEYVRSLFPEETIFVNVANGNNNELPDRFCVIEEVASRETPIVKFCTKPIQFTFRDIDHVLAYQFAWGFFNALSSCYDLDLPAVTVNMENYPAVKVNSVNPGNKPYNIGPDSESRKIFMFTLILLYLRRS